VIPNRQNMNAAIATNARDTTNSSSPEIIINHPMPR
jgi:hypothetical protein